MKHLIALLAFLFVSLASCAHVNPAPNTPTCKANVSSITWYADFEFTPDERTAIYSAASSWSSFSHGRVQNYVLFQNTPLGGAEIKRVKSTDQVVIDENATEAKARGLTAWTSLGWSEKPDVNHPRRMYLVTDLIPANQIETVTTHELGHAASLMWPGCPQPDPFQKCNHSPDSSAVMYYAVDGPKKLGPADLEFCEASCLCD